MNTDIKEELMKHRIDLIILVDNEDMYEHLIEVEYGVLEIMTLQMLDIDTYAL
jgi:hypothetical protein